MHLFRILAYFTLLLIVTTSFSKKNEDLFPFYSGSYTLEQLSEFSNDSSVYFVLKDSIQRPLCYFSDIFSPVCFDNTCKAIQIRLYWDLCGNFLGFKSTEHNPLTKKRHELFTQSDYYSLYLILNNPNAAVGKFDKQQLVNYNSVAGVDAFTGATVTKAENIVVAGAAYTTYTMWQLVHKNKLALYNRISIKNKKLAFWKKQFENCHLLSTQVLTKLLFEAETNNMLGKYELQKALLAELESMSVLNALLINNYLQRQNYLSPEIENKISGCKAIKGVFACMTPIQ